MDAESVDTDAVEADAVAADATEVGCAAGAPGALAPRLPSVVVERRVEWPDTDAAGHYHHSTVVRWVEAAEAVLLRRLGLSHLFGSTPRVHFEADYRARLWFGEAVRTELRVTKVGASSLHYAFTVLGEEGGQAATGRMVIAHSAARATGSTPWPADVREVLTKAGPQAPELITRTTGGTPCA
ncbi:MULTISPECIES: thioesterase family protein [unclassified Streptomyces]|uniref:acyl-CoA thioesterase n=1 Tax=unclassified Streptomyces TaxID=2593676 RepID=UPI0022527F04|nr:thioesterase family protein [Streptomyces sp. NBC_01551]MCX4524239.1 thioesterase family protein [Streptomyces sp. NBC_01551]